MRFDSGMSGTGGGSTAMAAGAGAAVGAGGMAAAQWARKTQKQAIFGLGLGIANAGVSIVGGNNNNTEAINAANTTNAINSLTFTAGAATGPEVGALKLQVATLSNIVARGLGNTDPMNVTGLRNGPTLPVPSSASTSTTIPTPIATTPATGFGNLGILLLIGVALYVVTSD